MVGAAREPYLREVLRMLPHAWSVLLLFWAIDVLADKWPPATVFGFLSGIGWVAGMVLDLLVLGPALAVAYVGVRRIYQKMIA